MDDIRKKLQNLKALHEEGLITEAEFQQQRSELLAQLTAPVAQGADTGFGGGATDEITLLPPLGTRLNQRYRLIAEAGKGGMGVVYKAEDEVDTQANGRSSYVAIKLLNPAYLSDERHRKNFQREAGKARRLRHQNIVGVYSLEEHPPWPFLVMEWLEGKTLNAHLAEHENGLPWHTIQPWLVSAAKALDYAHRYRDDSAQGIIHRDIKPGNLYLTQQERLVILDFGIARVINDSRMSQSIQLGQNTSGTMNYMPPEAFIGGHKASASDDLYGLAVTTYELLTGQLPYNGPLLSARTSTTPAPKKPEEITQHQWTVLLKGLHAEAAQRPKDIVSWVAELNGELSEKLSKELNGELIVETPLPQKKGKLLFWSACVLGGVIVTAGYLKLQNEPELIIKSTSVPETKAPASAAPIFAAAPVAEKKAAPVQPNATPKPEPVVANRAAYEPTMVELPAGRFQMGCVSGKNCRDRELPIHTVQVKGFYMSQTEITFAQWDACVAAGACKNKADDEKWGRDNRPVINVSWNDIKSEYLPWLNEVRTDKATRGDYRLPTEAQWEYAARAGSETQYSWDNSIDCSLAAYNGGEGSACYYKKSDGSLRGTQEVAQYAANAFGLYDMHGNVWEWVEDCWHSTYNNAPNNAEGAWEGQDGGNCGRRIVRGGSWFNIPESLRSANRGYITPSFRDNDIGFRIVQPLLP